MKNKIIKYCLVMAGCAFSAGAWASNGHDQGNGADYLSIEDGVAWFTGANQTVRVCVNAAPDFGFGKAELEHKVVTAFSKWVSYMNVKKVSSFVAPQLKIVSSCGSEDLTLHFGVSDQVVDTYRSRFQNPVSISVRTFYDSRKSWSKGFIWVAKAGSVTQAAPTGPAQGNYPDWSIPENLDAILLHEFGHVFGVPHVGGTIMDERIANSLHRGRDSGSSPFLTEIDSFSELVTCESCKQIRSGDLGVFVKRTMTDATGSHDQTIDTRAANFERLMGRRPVGSVSSSVEHSGNGVLRLVVSDSVNTVRLNFEEIAFSRLQSDSTAVFRNLTTEDHSSGYSFVLHRGDSVQGRIRLSSGRKILVMIQRNMRVEQPDPFSSTQRPTPLSITAPFTILEVRPEGAKLLFRQGGFFGP